MLNRIREEYVRNASLIFLISLWFINPSNKFIVLFFILFLGLMIWIIRKPDISLVIVHFVSSFFLVGKVYYLKLMDLGNFPEIVPYYPLGLTTRVQISLSDVIFSLLVVYAIIAFRRTRVDWRKLEVIDYVLIAFVSYGVLSDILVSSNLLLSLLLKKGLFEYLFIYFFVKFMVKDQSLLYKLFMSLLISLSLFEGFVIIQQFIYSSPIGNNLEATFSIESFGPGADELYFFFRPIGTFIHANLLGMFLATVMPLLMYLVTKSKKYFLKVTLFLVAVSLVLTLSRSGWIAAVLSFLLILFYLEYSKKREFKISISAKKLVLYGMLIVPLALYSFPRVVKISNIFQPGSGLDVRIRQADEVLGLISQSPIFGTGAGMSVVKALEVYPKGVFSGFPSEIHNFFMLQAVENGIPYSILFFTFLFLSFKKLFGYKKDLTVYSAVSIFALTVVALFQPFFFSQFLLLITAFNYDKISEDFYEDKR